MLNCFPIFLVWKPGQCHLVKIFDARPDDLWVIPEKSGKVGSRVEIKMGCHYSTDSQFAIKEIKIYPLIQSDKSVCF